MMTNYTKEQERKDLYKKLEQYLTFLDIDRLEATGRDIESKLEERDIQVQNLRKEIEDIKLKQQDATKKLMEAFKKSIKVK